MNSVIQILICCSVSEFQCPIKFHWHLEWNIYHKKKVAFRNGIQRNQRYIPISCARNISAMSSNIWLFCLEILLGLTVKRNGWSVYQWLFLVQPREPDSSLETMFSVDFCFSIDEKLEFLNHLLHKMVLIWLFCNQFSSIIFYTFMKLINDHVVFLNMIFTLLYKK